MPVFTSRSGDIPPRPVQTETDIPPDFVESVTFDASVLTEATATEPPIGPEGNSTTTEARPDPSWTRRELMDYAEAKGIPYPAGGCKSEIYAAVTSCLTTGKEDNNVNSG